MLWEPTESRYRRDNKMFHSSAFAIAAGVVGVAAAGTSAAVSMSAADKAAKGQAASGKKLEKQTKKATQSYEQRMNKATQDFIRTQNELAKQVGNINIPEYNLQNATLEGIEAANKVTENTIEQVKKLSGRDPKEMFDTLAKWEGRLNDQYIQVQQGLPLIDQQQAVVSGMIEGQLPEVTQQQITRALAERGGAGFSMSAAGKTPFIQTPQAMLAENILQSSEERMRAGLALAPGIIDQRNRVASASLGLSEGARGIFGSWVDAAQSFIQPVSQMMQLGAQGQESYLRSKMGQLGMIGDINTGIYGAERGYAQDMYNAMTGQAMQGYQVAQQGIEANLASRQAVAQGIQGIGSAAAGAIGGVGSAYSQLATAQSAGTVTGYGGSQYAPKTTSTGAKYYAPIGGSIY